jgi:hypothetical protein
MSANNLVMAGLLLWSLTTAASEPVGGGRQQDSSAAAQERRGPPCRANEKLCKATFGDNGRCYTPSTGESCTHGIICQADEKACLRSGGYCYKPAKGEQCQ